ncbi:MAG TPA: choice-of-anchor J domain-containing protein, partial [Candidatus Cloacimonadota bacterium]|nr:choice-of-anchor J domain-containing protein [Candidatus Cloacimonadota bacterium]
MNSSPYYISLDDITIDLVPTTPTFSLNPNETEYSFGNAVLDVPVTRQYTITNTGPGILTIDSIVATPGSDFSISVGPTDTALENMESTSFTVQFLPTAAGLREGTVTITHGIGEETRSNRNGRVTRTTHTIDFSGTGVDTTIYPPFTETFDNVTAPALPLGWEAIDNNGDGDKWVTYATNPKSAPNAAMLYTDYNTSNDDYLVTPTVVLTGSQRLSFWTRAASTSEVDELSVLLSTTTPTPEAFTNVLMASTPINFTSYAQYTIDLSSYSGSCYIAFARKNAPADGWRLYIDDVKFDNMLPVPPEAVTLTAPADAAYTLLDPLLTWTPSDLGEPATAYKVYMN